MEVQRQKWSDIWKKEAFNSAPHTNPLVCKELPVALAGLGILFSNFPCMSEGDVYGIQGYVLNKMVISVEVCLLLKPESEKQLTGSEKEWEQWCEKCQIL